MAKSTKSSNATSRTVNTLSFPPDTVEFLRELRDNNNRDWFTANKSRYDLIVKQPASDFCEEMCGALGKLTKIPHRSKVFRVHRDVRFSKDKTPYKAYLHMLFQPLDIDDAPKWFFGLEPDKLVLGTGVFGFEKDALISYRDRVAGTEGKALAKQLEKLRKAGVRIREPELKRVPTGYDASSPQANLLRHKGLTAWLDHPGGPDAAARSDIVATCLAGFKTLQPLFTWLHAQSTQA